MKDRRLMLHIHITALVCESIMLKDAQARAQWRERRDEALALHNWRVTRLRDELRHLNLAYGFIRGRTLDEMEPHPKYGPRRYIHVDKLRKALFTYGWPTVKGVDMSFLPDETLVQRLDDFNKKRRSEWALTRLNRLSEKMGQEL